MIILIFSPDTLQCFYTRGNATEADVINDGCLFDLVGWAWQALKWPKLRVFRTNLYWFCKVFFWGRGSNQKGQSTVLEKHRHFKNPYRPIPNILLVKSETNIYFFCLRVKLGLFKKRSSLRQGRQPKFTHSLPGEPIAYFSLHPGYFSSWKYHTPCFVYSIMGMTRIIAI